MTARENTAAHQETMLRDLEKVLEGAFNKRVQLLKIKQLTAGATKQTFRLDVSIGGEAQALILQTLPPSKLATMRSATQRTLTPEQDAKIMQLAHAQGVPAPGLVLWLDGKQGLGHGSITRFVAGETLAPKILRDPHYAPARQHLTAQCALALAQLHAIPAGQAAFLPTKTARIQWQENRALVDASGILHPALEWGLRWVEERLPDHDQLGSLAPRAPTPVHGDFRLGNLIVNADGLAAVIDWELAHLGDAMQDLAWLCLRTWRFGGAGEVAGVGTRGELFAQYEKHSGVAVDAARVFFWDMACQVRWAVMCLGMGIGGQGSGQWSGQAPVSLEHCLVGRRMDEPLWDMVQMARTVQRARTLGDRA